MDIVTPRNVRLSGFFRRSSAVFNTREKIPNCIDLILDALKNRYSEVYDLHGQEGIKELEEIMRKILILKDEVLRDEPFRKLNSNGPDIPFYNEYLIKQTCEDCRPTYLNTIRLYAECYVYRRIWEAFELTSCLPNLDPYKQLKIDKLDAASDLILKMGKIFQTINFSKSFENFSVLVKHNLWAGQIDIQKSIEFMKSRIGNLKNIDQSDTYILENNTEIVWNLLEENENLDFYEIDIVLDNIGYELFLDLCLADYLLTFTKLSTVRFHVKPIPWFVWNTLGSDITILLNKLKSLSKSYLHRLAEKWENNFKNSKWQIITRKFWCLPHVFSDIKNVDPWLYQILINSKLVILKGDINFRKAICEINLNPTITFEKALGYFHPTNIFSIRILKSGVTCGVCEKMEHVIFENQIYNHNIGFLQFAERKENLKSIFDQLKS